MSIRMRHTRGHTGNRRSHHALVAVTAVIDKVTGNLRLPHRIDEVTGMYRGKQIFSPRVKAVKTETEKTKGKSIAQEAGHAHDHVRDHENTEVKRSRGVLGKLGIGGRPKARSGFGGGA